MELIEIRDLDGPNVFLLEPAIKAEFRVSAADEQPEALAQLRGRLSLPVSAGASGPDAIGTALCEAVQHLHTDAGLPTPLITWEALETPHHIAVVYGWTHRRAAVRLATLLAAMAVSEPVDRKQDVGQIRQLAATTQDDDAPLMVKDAERTIPIVCVTGTNGKTTTTRLIAHILRSTGRRVGWCSSSGVYIEGEQVIAGDYTGPAGALRVLEEPDLQAGVLETARGGILLRGVAYQSNDVSVFTNISADHLDLQGIHTLEGLLRVKSTVVRVTTADGYAVLNADDALVSSLADQIRAHVFFVTQDSSNQRVIDHVDGGGQALMIHEGGIIHCHDHQTSELIKVRAIPITLGGRARHMIENALCAAAACLAFGLSAAEVRSGLATFTNDPEHNMGRLNIFEVDGTTVVVDFAHNEAGLRYLLALAHDLVQDGRRVLSIIGTAGDRTDQSLRAIGRLAAEQSDRIYIKETAKYLRGRSGNNVLIQLYIEGINAADCASTWSVEPSERAAITAALTEAQAGDVIAMMCVEQISEVIDFLATSGKRAQLS